MSIELKVSGMTCAHCEKAVHDALAGVDGVSSVQVDRNSGTASVAGAAVVSGSPVPRWRKIRNPQAGAGFRHLEEPGASGFRG